MCICIRLIQESGKTSTASGCALVDARIFRASLPRTFVLRNDRALLGRGRCRGAHAGGWTWYVHYVATAFKVVSKPAADFMSNERAVMLIVQKALEL